MHVTRGDNGMSSRDSNVTEWDEIGRNQSHDKAAMHSFSLGDGVILLP